MPNDAPYLFDLSQQGATDQRIDRPFGAPGLFLGTSAFTAAGWKSTFYPPGMKAADYLKFYATQFQTVEVDSTFYGTPSAATVKRWREKTPPDSIFAAKVPQVITHDSGLRCGVEEFPGYDGASRGEAVVGGRNSNPPVRPSTNPIELRNSSSKCMRLRKATK